MQRGGWVASRPELEHWHGKLANTAMLLTLC